MQCDASRNDTLAPMDAIALRKRFVDELRRALNGGSFRNDPEPVPDTLYHYTNAGGMLGILTTSSLWASESFFMNDASEMLYATEAIVRPLLDEKLKQPLPTVAAKVFRSLREGGSDASHRHYYVACFCKRDDLLNQWRAYASDQGYSLGFRTYDLLDYNGGDVSIRPVIYSQAKQTRYVNDILDAVVDYIERETRLHSHTQGDLDYLEGAALGLSLQELATAVLGFKHPSFEVEHEWRIVVTGQLDQKEKPKHRVGQYGLTPYIPLHVTSDGGRLPITSLRHGPSPAPEISKRAMKSLLIEHGYDPTVVEILGTEVPLRA